MSTYISSAQRAYLASACKQESSSKRTRTKVLGENIHVLANPTHGMDFHSANRLVSSLRTSGVMRNKPDLEHFVKKGTTPRSTFEWLCSLSSENLARLTICSAPSLFAFFHDNDRTKMPVGEFFTKTFIAYTRNRERVSRFTHDLRCGVSITLDTKNARFEGLTAFQSIAYIFDYNNSLLPPGQNDFLVIPTLIHVIPFPPGYGSTCYRFGNFSSPLTEKTHKHDIIEIKADHSGIFIVSFSASDTQWHMPSIYCNKSVILSNCGIMIELEPEDSSVDSTQQTSSNQTNTIQPSDLSKHLSYRAWRRSIFIELAALPPQKVLDILQGRHVQISPDLAKVLSYPPGFRLSGIHASNIYPKDALIEEARRALLFNEQYGQHQTDGTVYDFATKLEQVCLLLGVKLHCFRSALTEVFEEISKSRC